MLELMVTSVAAEVSPTDPPAGFTRMLLRASAIYSCIPAVQAL